ncbi:MAG: Lrp/AsnC family transcriptional regulator [Thermoprotei archaeon]|jgi:Lrp/AsnC family transcriptional regulator for asnA, asnC and gidA
MDDKDKIIIEMLMKNARISLAEIAETLKISDVAVSKRIKKLEESGIIKGYTAIVDPIKLGYSSVAVIGIDVEPERLLEVSRLLREKDYVRYLALSTGDHMLILQVWSKNNYDLTSVLKDIASISGVKNVRPAIVLETIKGILD